MHREMERRVAEAVLAACMMHQTEDEFERCGAGSIDFLDSAEQRSTPPEAVVSPDCCNLGHTSVVKIVGKM